MYTKHPITYPRFVESAKSLETQQIKLSVRMLQAELGGGSSSKILEYLRRYTEELALAKQADSVIPEDLRHALLASFGDIINKTKLIQANQLTETQQQLQEAQDCLQELETNMADKAASYKAELDQANNTILTLEKQSAAEQERIDGLQRQLEKLESQLKEANQAAETARISTEKAIIQKERADEVTVKAEKQIVELQQTVTMLQKECREAQINAAVVASKMEELTK